MSPFSRKMLLKAARIDIYGQGRFERRTHELDSANVEVTNTCLDTLRQYDDVLIAMKPIYLQIIMFVNENYYCIISLSTNEKFLSN